MEQLATGILRRSSDAIVIISLSDGRILDVNEAFFTLTGLARRELVGRPWRDLLVGPEPAADPTAAEVPEELGSLADARIGLWTRSGELRIGELSALVLEFEGQRNALCTIREVRDPTLGQRRSIARHELDRILRSVETQLEPAARALQAFGRALRWETGALWRGAARSERLCCAAEWHAQQWGLGHWEAPTRYAASPIRLEALRRAWLRREATWIPDILADPERSWGPAGPEEPMHGWLAFPVLGAAGAIGMVEFLSRETRQPDVELLAMVEDFGRLFGRLLEHAEGSGIRLVEQAETVRPGTEEPAPGMVPDAVRDLAGAVAATTEALERHSTPPAYLPPSALLSELTAGVRKLNRLLEAAVQHSNGEPSQPAPSAPSGEAAVELPTGLTLKAVSQRTGIPAATLRTWEHRYEFMRPRRSPGGYRLYGTEEIARIERVKYLVGQGVRIGAAMKAVIEEAGDDRPVANPTHAEVYRLAARSPRGPRAPRGRRG